MSLRTSFVLMLLFIGLGYYAFFEPLRTSERDDLAKEKEAHVTWLKDKKVAAIEIHGEKGTVKLDCAKKDCAFDNTGHWQELEPVNATADSGTVGTLLGSILNLTHNGKLDFDKGFDEKEFGLDKPVATLTLGIPGAPVTFKIGRANPEGTNSYLSVSDDAKHLYLVPTYFAGMIDQPEYHWRDKRLFPGDEAMAVNRIAFRSKKAGDLEAVKKNNEWRLLKPRDVAASKIMFEGLASTLAYASAKALAVAGTKVSGAPALDITFALNGGESHRLRVFPHGKEVLALADKNATLFVLDSGAFDRFNKDPIEYRVRTPIDDAIRSQVSELHLKFPRDKHEVTLQFEKDMWAITAGDKPGNLMLSQGRLNTFVDSLRDSEYVAMFPLKGPAKEAVAFRSQPPDVIVELNGGGKTLYSGRFLVFERARVLTESEGDVRVLGGSIKKTLPVRLNDLTEPANKQVVTETKEASRGHDPQPTQHGK